MHRSSGRRYQRQRTWVPRYNEFRRLINLKPITKFEDLTEDKELVAKLKKIYNNDIEMIDLMVGSFAESVRPDGFGFEKRLSKSLSSMHLVV